MTIQVKESQLGDKRGFAFLVFYENSPKCAGFVSALFKTKEEATREAKRYETTGEFVFYGSAE